MLSPYMALFPFALILGTLVSAAWFRRRFPERSGSVTAYFPYFLFLFFPGSLLAIGLEVLLLQLPWPFQHPIERVVGFVLPWAVQTLMTIWLIEASYRRERKRHQRFAHPRPAPPDAVDGETERGGRLP